MEAPNTAQPSRFRYRTVFLSDVHLGAPDCRADYLLDFLNHVECDTLYLLGDIVDLWSLKKRLYWPPTHYEVIRTIFAKAQHGTRVVYIPGNHDVPLRDYVGQRLGPVEVRLEDIYKTRDGRRLLLFHGDILDPHIRLSPLTTRLGDAIYRMLMLCSRWANRARRLLGREYWSLASYVKSNTPQAARVIDVFAEAALEEARQRGLDGVICGHIHKPAIQYVDGTVYANCGDWVENCTALTESEAGEFAIHRWTERRDVVHQLPARHEAPDNGLSAAS